MRSHLGAERVHKTRQPLLHASGAAVSSAPARVKWTATSCAGERASMLRQWQDSRDSRFRSRTHCADSPTISSSLFGPPSRIESERKEHTHAGCLRKPTREIERLAKSAKTSSAAPLPIAPIADLLPFSPMNRPLPPHPSPGYFRRLTEISSTSTSFSLGVSE